MINGLRINGHTVEVLTVPIREGDNYFDNSNDVLNDVKVFFAEDNKLYSSLVENKQTAIGALKKLALPILRKVYHSISIFDNSINVAKKLNKDILFSDKYDLIISSSDPKSSHIAVSRLIDQGIKYDKWIQYWGDPLTLDITKKTIIPNAFIRKTEFQMLSRADKIIYVSPITLTQQRELFPSFSNRMEFVPIPYLKEKNYEIRDNNEEHIKLGYFGDYNTKIRDLLPFYHACQNNKFNCIIAGNSDLELKSNNYISVSKRIPQKEVENLEAECDILVCVLNRKGSQIPGKLYHYAATNKPILVILDGEYEKEIDLYLNEFNRFYTCKNEIESIVRSIEIIKTENRIFEPSPVLKPEEVAKKVTS